MQYKKTSLTVVLFLILIAVACNRQQQTADQLRVNDFQAKLAATADAQLLDVRTPGEFMAGHLKNAINIDFNGDNFTGGVEHLDKSKPVFVYCLSGVRSSDAAGQMRNKGFTQVYEMQGGMMAWRAAHLAEEKPLESLAETLNMNDADFKQIVTDSVLVLVDFNATWCGPCKKLAPVLDELVQENTGRIKLVKIDIDQNQALAKNMDINAIPVVQLYKRGNKVWEQLGLCTKETIASAIKSNL